MENKEIKQNFFKNLNYKVNAMNKTSIILFILIYALILGGIVGLVANNSDDSNYLFIPPYEHVFYNDEVSSQFSIVGLRTFDDDDEMTLKYRVVAGIEDRYIESDTSSSKIDPNYEITRFKMNAGTSKTLTGQVNSIYYFTEHTGYTAPTYHTYILDNTSIKQNPKTIYSEIEYEKDGEVKAATFKEEIFLNMTNSEMSALAASYDVMQDSNPEASGVTLKDISNQTSQSEFGKLYFIAVSSDDGYNGGARISIDDRTIPYHVDMQSWILTSDNEYLPYIGVYNYTSETHTYTETNDLIDSRLNGEYICAKLVYYFGENANEKYTYYYKQAIDKLPTSFNSENSTTEPNDDTVDTVNTNTENIWWGIGIGVGAVALSLIGVVVYIQTKKHKKSKTKEKES
ncbi:MAG: hypothetical protein WCR33_00020 [Bacilli bacterium]